jgi:putative transposase
MPRAARLAIGGLVYHVLNRAAGRRRIFAEPADYAAFERILAAAQERVAMRLLAYCVMPNHWHLVLWPHEDGALSSFMARVTQIHTQRWHAHQGSAGTGALYQGRFKAFPVQADEHFLALCRYVERNPLRAGLVERAEDWAWSSLSHQEAGSPRVELAPWPVPRPSDWLEWVNQPQSAAEVEALRRSVVRARPYGGDPWVERTARRLRLDSTLRPRGRPRRPAESRQD